MAKAHIDRRGEPDCAARLRAKAREALGAALEGCAAAYDRGTALRRFHRLSEETIRAETPEAAQRVLGEIERALRRERGRAGHWTYDLNRHISLVVAFRAEKARLERLRRGAPD